MKEKIRNWYYMFVGDFFIRMYERIWYYKQNNAKYDWMKKLADKALEEITWAIVDNHMDFLKETKRNRNVDITITSMDYKSPFYWGKTIHCTYDEKSHMMYGEWKPV